MEQITILGRSFHLHCEESDRELLANAGRSVDRMLQQIRRNDPSLTAEMAAFLACIQLTYDQLNNKLQDNENSVQLSSIQAKLERLNKLFDQVPDVSVVAPPAPGEAPAQVHQVVKPPRFILGSVRSSTASSEAAEEHRTASAASASSTSSTSAASSSTASTASTAVKPAKTEETIPVATPAESGELF